jgi:tetratricopeptide (TPR) repeat protein
MQAYLKKHSRFKKIRKLLATALVMITPVAMAHATEWQKITRTTRHTVAIEMDSVQRDSSGNLSVLLRFTPRGEFQRRAAATEYGNKNYLLHLEQYKLNCIEKNSRLDFIDILGWKGKRLARLPGSGKTGSIIPDSVLDKVANLVCPEEDVIEDDDTYDSATASVTDKYLPDVPLPIEQRQRITDAQRLVATEPDNAAAWVGLGNAWYDAGMAKQAIEAYDRALKLKPNDSDVLNDQGAMYRQAGDTQRALTNFEKALAIDPSNLESLYNMGYLYLFDLHDTDRALEIWQRYLELDQSSETAEQVRSFIKRYENVPEIR